MELLSKSEFLERRAVYEKKTGKPLLWVGMALYVLQLPVIVVAGAYAKAHPHILTLPPGIPRSLAVDGMLLWVYSPLLCASLVAMIDRLMRVDAGVRLECPHCHSKFNRYLSEIAIATDSCGACGERVFANGAPEGGDLSKSTCAADAGKPTKEEFFRRWQILIRGRPYRFCRVMEVVGIGLMFGAFVAIMPVPDVQPWHRVIGGICCAAGAWLFVKVLAREKHALRESGLCCLRCEWLLFPRKNAQSPPVHIGVFPTTGCCPRCGERIFVAEAPKSLAAAMWTVSKTDLIRRVRARQKGGAILFVGVLILLAGIVAGVGWLHRLLSSYSEMERTILAPLIVISIVAILLWTIRLRFRVDQLNCPACAKNLLPPLLGVPRMVNLTIATNCCNFCGTKLFGDAPSAVR